MRDASQNVAGTTLLRGSGVGELRVVIPSWAALQKGADCQNTDLVEDFTIIDIS